MRSHAVIIPAYMEQPLNISLLPGDALIIAADRGCELCREAGIIPDICIGDFDSLAAGERIPSGAEIWPREKDDTDTSLALKKAISMGCNDILLAGGLGGRPDHSIANLQLMRYADEHDARMRILYGSCMLELLRPDSYSFDIQGTFSLFSASDKTEGLTISGAKYTLENGTLTNSFPLGISNEALPGSRLNISFSLGRILFIHDVSI